MADVDILAPDFQPTAPAGGGADILAPSTPGEMRADKLRKMARAVMDQSGGTPGAGDRFSDAFTFGLMKPTAGLAGALGGEVGELMGGEPASFGERYSANVGAYQDRLDEAGKNSGALGTGADIAGSVLAGGPARGVVERGLWPMLKGALGYGAVEGAARNSEDPMSAIKGAAGGAAVAGATTGALGGISEMVKQALPASLKARRAERLANRGEDPAGLRTQSKGLFKQLDDAGVAYDNNQSVGFVDDLISDLKQNGWSPKGVHAPLNGVIDQLQELRGQPMSLETLQQLREQIGSEAGANEPQIRRIAGRLLGSIDGFVTNVDPAMSSLPTDQIAPMWKEARRLWRTANTAEDIGWRLDKADRRSASTGSGTNIDNPIRQNIRGVLDKAEQPRRFNPYSADELAQMERVVEGSPTQNLLRSFGNRFGGSGPMAGVQGNVLGGVGGLGAMLHGTEPTMAALLGGGTAAGLYGAGKGARMAADKMSQDEADALVRLISTGSLDAGPRLASQAVPTRASLARLMAQQTLGRGAGVYAGGEASR